jgi:hypothetical protein
VRARRIPADPLHLAERGGHHGEGALVSDAEELQLAEVRPALEPGR